MGDQNEELEQGKTGIYEVDVVRIGYSFKKVRVPARDAVHAQFLALEKAGSILFPSESTSEYEAEGCELVEALPNLVLTQ